MSTTLLLLIQSFVILVVPTVLRTLSGTHRFIPLVVVQIMVGIALGPSVFGRLCPDVFATFVTADSVRALSAVASLAVLLFGLITGLHLGSDLKVGSARIFVKVLTARFMVPTSLGFATGLWIISRYEAELLPGVHSTQFALAIAIACGMTALPVLGMILGEMKLLESSLAKLALGVAGVTDTVLWMFIGLLLTAKTGGGGTFWAGLASPALMIVYLAALWLVVKPMLRGLLSSRLREGNIGEGGLMIVIAVTIASAAAVERIGLDYVIGACLAGVVMPSEVKAPILDRLHFVTTMFLMPFFFVLTGLRTFIDPSHAVFWEAFVFSTIAAGAGAFAGVAFAARSAGASWRQSTALGGLLQAKGMMEVIVVSIFLNAGLISSNIFAALILMGVVCTMLTLPLTRLAFGDRQIGDLEPETDRAPILLGTEQEVA